MRQRGLPATSTLIRPKLSTGPNPPEPPPVAVSEPGVEEIVAGARSSGASAQHRLARKRSLSRRGFAYRLLGAAGLIALTAEIGDLPGLEVTEIAAGLAALVAVFGAVEAGVRAYRINLGSPAKPKVAASELPAQSSRAHAPLIRLASRESELAEHLTVLPVEVAADTWRHAAEAARALRTHAERITTFENGKDRADHEPDRLDLLASRLQEGVSAYERLTDTAAELVGPDPALPVSRDAGPRLADATDALVGMMRGLSS